MSTLQKDIVNALMKGVLSICGVMFTWLIFDMRGDIQKISNNQEIYVERTHQIEIKQDVLARDVQHIQKAIDKLER